MLHVVVCNLSSGKIKYVEKEMRRQLGGILRWHREGHQVDGSCRRTETYSNMKKNDIELRKYQICYD